MTAKEERHNELEKTQTGHCTLSNREPYTVGTAGKTRSIRIQNCHLDLVIGHIKH